MSTFSGDIGPEEEDGAGWGGLVASKAELRAEAQQAALERDAKRYRWLRAGMARTTGAPKGGRIEIMRWEDRCEANVLRGEVLDAAIDAAMARSKT